MRTDVISEPVKRLNLDDEGGILPVTYSTTVHYIYPH